MLNQSQEQETWDIKCFSAEDFATAVKDARLRWQEEMPPASSLSARGTCVQCGVTNVPVQQHWNDVGGPGTEQCEMCWVDGIVWFWLNEQVAEQTSTELGAKPNARHNNAYTCDYCGIVLITQNEFWRGTCATCYVKHGGK